MLTQLEIFKSGVTTPPLNVTTQDVSMDFLQIIGITGLDPVKASIQKEAYGNIDGEYLTGINTLSRNIVITIGLNPDWRDHTYESLRDVLYRYFMSKSEVELQFTTDVKPKVSISGVVEGIEAAIFGKDPVYQVSIICTDSDFVALEPTVVPGLTTVNYVDIVPFEHWNQGNTDTGFTLTVTAASPITDANEIRIINYTDDFQMFLAQGVPFDTTHSIEIVTLDKKHSMRKYYTPSSYDDISKTVEPTSAWVQLRENLNRLAVISNKAGLAYTLSYNARFGGL